MALSPIGNVTYINQNSQVGSMQHANAMQKVDFALNANMQEFVDKLKAAVQEVAPAQEAKAIDPDDKQEKKNEQESHKDSESAKESESLAVVEDDVADDIACVGDEAHLLDILA